MERIHVGNQEIIVGDCREALQQMEPATIDVVITSPPYNLGMNYRSYDDNRPRDEYLAWMRDVGDLVARVMKPSASFFLNLGGTNSDPWIMMDVANVMRARFVLQNHIVWIKSISVGNESHGHFKPINSRRYLNHLHESVYHLTLDGHVPIDRLAIGVEFQDKTNIRRRGHPQDRRCAGDVWFVPYPTVQSKQDKYNHPSSFPVELAARCIKLHGVAEAVVLDPFLGSGTTLVAAARLGQLGIGIEIDPLYAEKAAHRLQSL
jgi:site-specific DNA-methyltransferase (adenine-specific)